jgi:hypothetical protein
MSVVSMLVETSRWGNKYLETEADGSGAEVTEAPYTLTQHRTKEPP